MNKKYMAHCPSTVYPNKRQQQGLTLVEVLVSVVVLALGVSALLMTQLRAVSGVRESEGQTIVAQATQNLVEGMLANPILVNASTEGWTTKSYTHYNPTTAAASDCTNSIATLNQAALAKYQLGCFRKEMEDKLNNTIWAYHICQDDSGKEPEVAADYRVNFHCNGSGGTVVKVIWQINNENNKNNDGNEKLTQDRAIYTYQTHVTN